MSSSCPGNDVGWRTGPMKHNVVQLNSRELGVALPRVVRIGEALEYSKLLRAHIDQFSRLSLQVWHRLMWYLSFSGNWCQCHLHCQGVSYIEINPFARGWAEPHRYPPGRRIIKIKFSSICPLSVLGGHMGENQACA